jgi:hypothetical protein
MARLELVEQAGQVDLKPVLADAASRCPSRAAVSNRSDRRLSAPRAAMRVPGELGDACLGGAGIRLRFATSPTESPTPCATWLWPPSC